MTIRPSCSNFSGSIVNLLRASTMISENHRRRARKIGKRPYAPVVQTGQNQEKTLHTGGVNRHEWPASNSASDR